MSCSELHLFRLMLDSNTFDYIYDSGLTDKVQSAVNNEKLHLFATDVQDQEIEKISNDTKKQVIRQTAEKIRVRFMESWGMVVGSDRPTKKGFGESRINHCRVPSDQDVQL